MPCPGPPGEVRCPCGEWEEFHRYTWPEWDTFQGRFKWVEFSFEVVPPFDRLITAESIRGWIGATFIEQIREGGALRMCFANKATRVAGVPVLWHYAIYLEYHESPNITVGAILEGFAAVVLLAIGVTLTFKLLGEGTLEKIGDEVIKPAVQGIALIFILGIGFVVALSYLLPGVEARARPPLGAGRVIGVEEVRVRPRTRR